MQSWLGVDVGGERKGFDAALIDDHKLALLHSRLTSEDVVDLVRSARPAVVGVDSPRSCASAGESTRLGERQLARTICGIRWTPDETRVRASPYYGWIVEGLALYDALGACDVEVIEVFPTASWTRWHGKRSGRRRSAWTKAALAALDLDGHPARINQDQRDAIAAAVTAREYSYGLTERMGEIVVPQSSSPSIPCGPNSSESRA